MFSAQMHIGIIGNGKMGNGIFQYLTEFEFGLTLVCEKEEQSGKIIAAIEKRMARLTKNGILSPAQADKRLKSISIVSDLSAINNADLIIEAIPENVSLKRNLFAAVEKIAKPDCIFTSNTSSIPPSIIFQNLKRKENCAGLHFFYPVNLKDIAEINATPFTSVGTIIDLQNFLKHTHKFYLTLLEPETFIINKIFLDIQAEACRIEDEGLLTPVEIDALVNEYIFPGGIFLFFDHVGIDVMYASIDNYTAKLSDRANYNVVLNKLKQMIDNKLLGIKSGKGFYDHSGGIITFQKIEPLTSHIYSSCHRRLSEAFYQTLHSVIQNGICSEQQLDYIVKEYTGSNKGPFENKITKFK